MRDDLIDWAFILSAFLLVFMLCELALDRAEARRQGRKPATLLDGLRRLGLRR